jgi:hypothetical protein
MLQLNQVLDTIGFGRVKGVSGYEKYKDDDLGHWYFPSCDIDNWPDKNDEAGFFEFQAKYRAEHPLRFFLATETPPTPEVPPEVLREWAIESLTLPKPELDWNPKLKGKDDATLVNFETWFWLDNASGPLTVRAEAGNNYATVTATLAGMDISAPGEGSKSCDGSGTPYVKGAQNSTCALAFRRASTALGTEKTPVTVTSRWTATWEGTGVDTPTPIIIPTQPKNTVDIRVLEVQTLVTGTG